MRRLMVFLLVAAIGGAAAGAASSAQRVAALALAGEDGERGWYVREGRVLCAGNGCPADAPAKALGASAVVVIRGPEGERLYAAVPRTDEPRTRLIRLDPATGEPLESAAAGPPLREAEGRVTGLASGPDGRTLLAWGALPYNRREDTTRGFVLRVDPAMPGVRTVLPLPSPPLAGVLQGDGSRLWLLLERTVQTVTVPIWSLSWSFDAPAGNTSIALRDVDRPRSGVVPAATGSDPVESGGASSSADQPLFCLGGDSGVVCMDPTDRAERGVLPSRIEIPLPRVESLLIAGDGLTGVAIGREGETAFRWESAVPASDAMVAPLPSPFVAAGVDAAGAIRLAGGTETGASLARLPESAFRDGRLIAAIPPARPEPPTPAIVAEKAVLPPPAAEAPRPTAPPTPVGEAPRHSAPPAPAPSATAPSATAPTAPPQTPAKPAPPAQAPPPPAASSAPAQPPPKAEQPAAPQPPPPPAPVQAAQPAAAATPPPAKSAAVPPPAQATQPLAPPSAPAQPPAQPPPSQPAPPPSATAPAQPPPSEVISEATITPVPASPEAGAGTISGTIANPRAVPLEVVVLGPDSLLREAARVSVASGGAWRAEGLLPGRYRVVLQGPGGAPVAAEPPFRTVVLTAEHGAWAEFMLP